MKKFLTLVLIFLLKLTYSQKEKCLSNKVYDIVGVYNLKDNKYTLFSQVKTPWEVCFSETKTIFVQDTISKNYFSLNIIYNWMKDKKYNYEVLDVKKDTLYATVHNDSLWYYFDIQYPDKLIRYSSKK